MQRLSGFSLLQSHELCQGERKTDLNLNLCARRHFGGFACRAFGASCFARYGKAQRPGKSPRGSSGERPGCKDAEARAASIRWVYVHIDMPCGTKL